MSKANDDDERRRRSLEAGREMLEKYKAERANKAKGSGHSQTDEASDIESFHNDKSLGHRESYVHEGVSSRDMTQSSVSMSEGEADGDLEGLAGRVAQLEELLQGKEAIVEALHAEIDHLRAEASSPNSSQSSIHGRDIISLYHTKLQEFEKAINQRDNLIEELTWSLQQSLSSRDTLVNQLSSMNAIQIPSKSNAGTVNDMDLQEKNDILETTLSDQRSLIQKLTSQLTQIQEHVQMLEMEKETRNAEISDYKLQINNLNEKIRSGAADKNLNIAETLEQQKQYEARVDKIKQDMQHILEKFTAETNMNTTRHQQELKELSAKKEIEIMNIQEKYEDLLKQLKEENKMLADRLNKELPDLETRHAKELSIFQAQMSHYKKTVEALKLELVNRSESQQTAQAEVSQYKSKLNELKVQYEKSRRTQELDHLKAKEMLAEQIKLHKLQLEEMTSKYVTVTAILESKESIERSLEQALTDAATMKVENEGLKFKLDDLSSRYSAAQSLIENSQVHERTLNNKIYDLEKSLSRLSGINVSTLSELNETSYQTFDEVAIQYQLTKQKLEEKAELEKLLVNRIDGLENDVRKTKAELDEANLTKKSYEKQLKDMKNMCDKYKSELSLLKKKEPNGQNSLQTIEQNRLSGQSKRDAVSELLYKTEEDQQEIEKLKMSLEQKVMELAESTKNIYDLTEKLKKSEEECQDLKNGLAIAWAQCAEVEEKLNQTLASSDSKLDVSTSTSSYSSNLMKQFHSNKTMNASMNTTHDQSTDTNKAFYENNEELDTKKITLLQAKLASATEENETLLQELERLKEELVDYEEVKNKLNRYSMLSEDLSIEKERALEENRILKKKLESIHSLQEFVNQLRADKESLHKEIEALICVHNEQINAIKAETAAEINKVQSLALSVKGGTTELHDLKAELETRHAKEMEELRMYFEQKCLLMEKQYSEEIFSQQSKKMSDNDSEVADLTEGLYFGGAGDCLNVSNISERSSRVTSPLGDEHLQLNRNNFNSLNKSELEYETTIKALQQELKNRIIEVQDIKLHYEKALEDQKNRYERDLYDSRGERHGFLRNTVNEHCQTEWDAGALENGELTQLRAAYNHQLEEQIALAKVDIVNALQEQIQALLMVESDAEDNWSSELLELRDKLTNNAKREMQLLKETHTAELCRLKEEHSRNVARMIDRHQEELNKIRVDSGPSYDGKRDSNKILHVDRKILEERNSLSKTCATLKTLVEELIKYFVICEEEVNNTLTIEVLKRQLCDSVSSEKSAQVEEIQKLESQDSSTALNSSQIRIQRVHFAPQTTEIISIINSDTENLPTIMKENDDITEKLKQELNNCIRRLKTESAEILGTTLTTDGDRRSALAKQITWINKVNEELTLKLRHAEFLIVGYQEETEQLKVTILDLQRKLINLENKKEIITEGYGENNEVTSDITLQDFSQLQEKARHVLSNGGGDSTELLQLIEELCRQSEKLMEDARKEKEDLQQQIEAADKQLKATRRFLDEQASEREVERDETTKQIHILQEQLKDREREKERDLRITSETTLSPEPTSDVPVLQASDISIAVEALESQMREMSSLISDTEAKKTETESELKAAVDKIWVLREIITDLEQQLQMKTEKEESLQIQINQLETVIAVQTKNQHELVQELDSIKMGSESKHLNEHISLLQEELKKHKLSSEQFNVNSAALKQMKTELREMQIQLDKRIKDLESAHMCSSNLSLSQPSEDVSIREQIDASRCPTPDDPTLPPMLPLDQLLKLKEKMMKHARAEEVVFKRIKDLEMQVSSLKNQNEDLQAEQEILQQTASEQLFQIEVMRGRLEQHKQNAPFAQRQATSRLELQLHEATTKFESLERTIADKDLELKDMKNQLDRVNQLLQEKEAEIANIVQVEGTTIQKLKEHLEVAEEEKRILQAQVGVQEHAQLELPRLIDSMLADKNEEIDHLKEHLSKKEKQLELYSSLNLDETQLRELARQADAKNSARTLSDILSLHSECEETTEAIRGMSVNQILPDMSAFKVPSSLMSSKNADESMVPLINTSNMVIQVPPLDLGTHSQSSSATPNQPSVGIELLHSGFESKTSGNSVSMDETDHLLQSRQRNNKIHESPERESDGRNESNNENKLYVTSIKHTQTSINETIKEIENLENQLQTVREELQMKSTILEKRETDLMALQKHYEEQQLEFREVVETLARDKCFYQNQYELSHASESKIKKDLQEIENVLKLKIEEIEEHKNKMQVNQKIIMELNLENTKLKDTEEKAQEQARKFSTLLQERIKELQNLRDAIFEKDITIETIQTRNIEIENENKQLYEFKTKYQSSKQEIMECQNEIQRLREGLNNRDQIIRRLEDMARRSSFSGTSSPSNEKDQEIHHLQEYLKEKDKVIRQMSDDSKSLHRALETIQNKMKESGNVVELRRKLKDERKLNTELRDVVEKLSHELSDLKLSAQRLQDDTDIEDMVQRELNLSAHLDRQIMNAIESDAEDNACRVEKQTQHQDHQEGVQRGMELKLQLSQANKINEELKNLKDDLEIERGILKCQIAEYEGRIFQLTSNLAEESKKVAKLDEELSSEKNVIRSLKIQIEKEHRAMKSGHIQDSELIEFLQHKLKTSLDNEAKLRNDLSLLRQEHKSLEIQLSLMKDHVQSQKADDLPKLTDLLETERKKYLTLVENFEKAERNNAELRDTVRKLQMEKNRFEKQLEVEVDEKEKLISSLALIEGIKDHLQTDLRRTKEDFKAREKECEWLQKRIKSMSDTENRRQEQSTTEHNELKALRREINNAREVMMDLEADMKQSKREVTESLEREMKLAETLETLRERETDLLKRLSACKDEEQKLRDTIIELQQDLRATIKRESDLSKELKSKFTGEKNVPAKFIQKIKDLSDINEKYANEKSVLQEKLIKAREEKEQLSQRVKLLEAQVKRSRSSQDVNVLSPDYVDKLHHFYGKYMRAESRRKALTYQKRYLLTIVGGYQLSEENTLTILSQLTKEQRSYTIIARNKKSPKVRFKSAALVFVSIHRMKWLILRSSIGKRIGVKTLLWNVDQAFIPVQKVTTNHSPPVREKPTSNGDGGFGEFALEQYYQRLKNIQETLGLAMVECASRQILPE